MPNTPRKRHDDQTLVIAIVAAIVIEGARERLAGVDYGCDCDCDYGYGTTGGIT